MSSRNLDILDPTFLSKVRVFQELCKQSNFDVLVYCTVRSFEEQAKLFRSSRTSLQVKQKMDQLTKKGFPELAEVLQSVGPQSGTVGKHVTNAGPGESWHQFGQAFDGCPLIHGKSTLNSTKYVEWITYGKLVKQAGLQWAGDWVKFKEYPHVQLSTVSNPLTVLTRDQVKKALEKYRSI